MVHRIWQNIGQRTGRRVIPMLCSGLLLSSALHITNGGTLRGSLSSMPSRMILTTIILAMLGGIFADLSQNMAHSTDNAPPVVIISLRILAVITLLGFLTSL